MKLRLSAVALVFALAACGAPIEGTTVASSTPIVHDPIAKIQAQSRNEHLSWEQAETKKYLDAVHAENARKAAEARRQREVALAAARAARSAIRPRPADTAQRPPAQTSSGRWPAAVERWRPLVSQYPWSVETVLRIMKCESGGNPNAVGPRQPNGSHPIGLMQILNGPFDPAANIALAYKMYSQRGWQPWACG